MTVFRSFLRIATQDEASRTIFVRLLLVTAISPNAVTRGFHVGTAGNRSAGELPMQMSKRVATAVATIGVMAISSADARAQAAATTGGGVARGYSDVAGVLGLGGIGEASIALGARYEKIIKNLPDMNDGLLGIRAGLDWYSFSVLGYSWSYIPLSVSANYHFKMQNRKFDPFVGAGLGYYIVSEPSGYVGSGYNSGVYFIGVIGMRYFMNENMAFYADAGAGAGALHVGLSWKLGKGGA